ncbi:hypothetical protein [Vibrio anguillarum]|uniref:Uncharacterized protein n=1 Tax=Vibrio anguillarum TaxID=55601 RepID=A0ABD4R098_VIBAN|nr:hypothetical protein [Vibrio anguillarum]MBT2920696.1 hypothetical protein [Vibrio anguillarum]
MKYKYKYKYKYKFLTLISLVALDVNAGNTTTETYIKAMYTYGKDTGTAENMLLVKVLNPVQGCEDGFYISPEDNRMNNGFSSLLLSAFHANAKVYFAAYTHDLKVGRHCKAHSVGLVR